MRRSSWLFFSLFLLGAISARAEVMPFDIEIGYRWLDVSGNEDMYRTQIDERSGVLIRAFTMTSHGSDGFIDQFRIDANDLGVGPASSIRIEAGSENRFRLRLGYRKSDAFSALPGFANPFLSQGIVPGQHIYDRSRTMFDADLEFLPNRTFTPFIGYSSNRYEGPGRTTYFIGQDEFQLFSDLNDSDTEIRAGLAFNTAKIQGVITQGWRDYSGEESLVLVAGANAGNNSGPILGRPVNATDLQRRSQSDASTPFTNAILTGTLTSRVRLIGQFSRFAAETDALDSESAAGSFVSFPLGRFFNGLNEEIDARAKNTTWRGSARAEITLVEGIDLLAGYRSEHRELSGTSLINTLYRDSITFGGGDPRDVQTILNTSNALERDENVIEAAIVARALGPVSLRFGYANAKQDVSVTPDLAEITIPGGQGGTFERSIDSFDASAAYRARGFLLSAAYRLDTADDPILRTDFIDRNRIRVRAGWADPRNRFRAAVTGEQIDQKNDRADIDFDSQVRQVSADIEFAPAPKFSLRANAARLDADSDILFRRPQTLVVDRSFHTEEGTSYGGGVTLALAPVTFTADVSRFENEGTNVFKIDRIRARVVYDFIARAGIAAEISKDEYNDTTLPLGDYEASRYGIYLRFRP